MAVAGTVNDNAIATGTVRRATEGDPATAQADARAVLGIPRLSLDMYSVIERGKNAPSFDRLEQIAERLGVAVAYLFTFLPKS